MSDQKKSPSSNGAQETQVPSEKMDAATQALIDGIDRDPDPEQQEALQKLLDDPTL